MYDNAVGDLGVEHFNGFFQVLFLHQIRLQRLRQYCVNETFDYVVDLVPESQTETIITSSNSKGYI